MRHCQDLWKASSAGKSCSSAPAHQQQANGHTKTEHLPPTAHRTCCSPTSCCQNQASAWVDVSAAACALLSLPRPHRRSAPAFTTQPPSANVACAAPAHAHQHGYVEGTCTCKSTTAQKPDSARSPPYQILGQQQLLPTALPWGAHLAQARASCHCLLLPT